MCVIAICKKRMLTDKEIEKMWENNSHGAGLCWWEGTRLKFKKGFMKLEDLKKFLKEITNPYIIHFRQATSGGINPEMTHPFVIYGKNRLEGFSNAVLFHNGIEDVENLYLTYCLVKKIKYQEVSDTYMVAKLVSVLGFDFLKALKSKYVVAKHNKEIITYGNFEDIDGVLVSNTYWKYNFDFYLYGVNSCPLIGKEDLCSEKNYSKCRFSNDKCPYKFSYKEGDLL